MHVDERIELVGKLVRAASDLGQTYAGPTPGQFLLRLEKVARQAAKFGESVVNDDYNVGDRSHDRLEEVVRDLLRLMVPETRIEDDVRSVMNTLGAE